MGDRVRPDRSVQRTVLSDSTGLSKCKVGTTWWETQKKQHKIRFILHLF